MSKLIDCLGGWAEALLWGLGALLVSHTLIGPVFIPSSSMEPTMHPGDYLVVNRVAYGIHVPFTSDRELVRWASPARGDIVVFNVPVSASAKEELYIKRAVAIAGDTVEVRDHKLIVNGRAIAYSGSGLVLTEALAGGHRIRLSSTANQSRLADMAPLVVPAEHIFVLGDNRANSLDSRAWGPLPLERVRGQAVFRAFGFSERSAGTGWLD